MVNKKEPPVPQVTCLNYYHFPDLSKVVFEPGRFFHTCPGCGGTTEYEITQERYQRVREALYGKALN